MDASRDLGFVVTRTAGCGPERGFGEKAGTNSACGSTPGVGSGVLPRLVNPHSAQAFNGCLGAPHAGHKLEDILIKTNNWVG